MAVVAFKPKWDQSNDAKVLSIDLQELNKNIPKPKIDKLTSDGNMELGFSDKRLIEQIDV